MNIQVCSNCNYPKECHSSDWHNDDCSVTLGGNCDCCSVYVCKNYMETEMRIYPCRVQNCKRSSVYFAQGNTARYGHVCEECWKSFTPAEQGLYSFDWRSAAQIESQKERSL